MRSRGLVFKSDDSWPRGRGSCCTYTSLKTKSGKKLTIHFCLTKTSLYIFFNIFFLVCRQATQIQPLQPASDGWRRDWNGFEGPPVRIDRTATSHPEQSVWKRTLAKSKKLIWVKFEVCFKWAFTKKWRISKTHRRVRMVRGWDHRMVRKYVRLG